MTREEIFEESGRRGENKVEQVLESAYSGCFIHNVLFRYYGFVSEICSMEIDYICILKKHVYVIEVKNWNTITKYDSRKDEYHVLINKVNRHFKSPIYQNVGHRELLSQLFNISEDRIVCIIQMYLKYLKHNYLGVGKYLFQSENGAIYEKHKKETSNLFRS